jgi:iron complex outermembrane receptor protein
MSCREDLQIPFQPVLSSLLLSLAFASGAQAQAVREEAMLGEVAVSATRSQSQELRRNASAGKIVYDRGELEALDAASMGELLSKLPGTGMVADMDGGPRGRQRGPDRNMPQILVDGQPLPGGARNPMAALRLPVELIERVEIIRNSTAEFPVLSPGGVINLILRDVPNKRTAGAKIGVGATDGHLATRLEGQYGEPDAGNFGYLLSGAYNSRPLIGQQSVDAMLLGGAPGTLHEAAAQSGEDRNLTLSPRFSWNLGDGQKFGLTPFLTHTETDRVATVDRVTSGISSRDRINEEGRRTSGRLTGEWKLQAGGGTETALKAMAQGERDHSVRLSNRFDAGGGLSESQLIDSLREEREGLLELRRKQLLGDSHLLTGAVEWRDKVTDDAQWRSSGSANAARMAEVRKLAWVQDEWQLNERQVLTPGLRYQVLDTRVEDAISGAVERTQHALDPSLHYLWQVTDSWNLRASIAQNTKAPYSRDLSPLVREAAGGNSSGNPDRGGNASLEAERLRSIEFGVEHFLADRAGTIGLSVFDRVIDRYIQRLIADEGGRWVERPYNVGKAQLRGAVFDYKSKLGLIGLPELTLRGNLAYTQTHMLEQIVGLGGGEGPRKSANLGWDYELTAYRTTLGGNFNYVSAIDRESSATLKQWQGARRQLDLYGLFKLDKQLSLRLSAQNVTREGRTNRLQQTDGAGNLLRIEDDRVRGVATYFVTLESKW